MPSSKLLSANQLSLIRRSKPNKVITNKKEHFHSFHLKVFIAVFIVFPLLALAANTPPKASAGSSKVVIYPSATSTALSGSGSDAEGPVTFQWTQSGGPSTAIIAKPTSPSTTVSSLKPGLYTFKLTVKDNSGVTTRSSTTVSTLEKITWTINGTKREALVHPSSVSGAAPVLFSFHGHTGTDSGWTKKHLK